jgi:hypothetical protein
MAYLSTERFSASPSALYALDIISGGKFRFFLEDKTMLAP